MEKVERCEEGLDVSSFFEDEVDFFGVLSFVSRRMRPVGCCKEEGKYAAAEGDVG